MNYDEAIFKIHKVYCAAEVWVNEKHCGDIWKAPYQVKVRDALVKGRNTIRIKAVNTLINEAIDPSRREDLEPIVLNDWPYFGNVINNIRKKYYFNTQERMKISSSKPSGLMGTAVIHFFKHESD